MTIRSAFVSTALACLFLPVLLAVGCAPASPWQQTFQPSSNPSPVLFTPREQAQIRVVQMDQVNSMSEEWKHYYDEHKLAPEDASAADHRALRQLMFAAFRIREDPDQVAELGDSQFFGKTAAFPEDPQLIGFAKSIGADFVVLATMYAGERPGYSSVPVTTTTFGSGWGRHYYGYGTSSSTTFVPVPVVYQQWSNVAFYFRRVSPEERAAIDATYRPAATR